jgi:hypothetical protein
MKPAVCFDSRGETGNIFFILKLCANSLDSTSYLKLKEKVLNSKSYTEALGVIREEVDLIDLRGER